MAILLLLTLLVQASEGERRSGRKKGGKSFKPRKAIRTTLAPIFPVVEDIGEDVVEDVVEDVDKNIVEHISGKTVAEEDAEWIPTVTVAKQPRNVCPPELQYERSGTHPCICRDGLDNQALMIQCVALISAHEMHKIIQVTPSL